MACETDKGNANTWVVVVLEGARAVLRMTRRTPHPEAARPWSLLLALAASVFICLAAKTWLEK